MCPLTTPEVDFVILRVLLLELNPLQVFVNVLSLSFKVTVQFEMLSVPSAPIISTKQLALSKLNDREKLILCVSDKSTKANAETYRPNIQIAAVAQIKAVSFLLS